MQKTEKAESSRPEIKVGGKYRLGRKIDSGTYSDVFAGTNLQTGEELAVKREPVSSNYPMLIYEAKLYRLIAGGKGVPKVHWYGVDGDYNYMVIDLLGPSLEKLFCKRSNKFSMKSILMLADQMLERVEYVHSKSLIHRDIKPDNFLMGIGKKVSQVHVVDFGLSKTYRDPKTKKHIPYREKTIPTGTPSYASCRAHLGNEQSRRDDLEALGYVFMYFVRGGLPWQGLRTKTKKEGYELITKTKINTSVESLCKGYPPEFATYMNYCKGLGFEDKPDYAYLRGLFKEVFSREGFQLDYAFDWTGLNGGKTPTGDDTVASSSRGATRDQSGPLEAMSPTSGLFQRPSREGMRQLGSCLLAACCLFAGCSAL